MQLSLLRRSKGALAVAVLLSIAVQGVAANAADVDDTEALFEHLFPEAQGRLAAPVSPPDAQQGAGRPSGALRGFKSQERRHKWTEAQVNAMREAFREKERPPAPPAGVMPVPDESGLYDPTSNGDDEQPYASVIKRFASEHNVSVNLISQMIKHESRFDPNAISPKGAQGLMQLMPDLSKKYQIDAFDPVANIEVGTRYFAELLAKYGSVDLALAAYNAGPGNVDKYGGIPPFPETENYVSSIMAAVAQLEARN